MGLVTYTAQRRTKEMGIRKVLGAGISGILILLAGDFFKLVAASLVIAWPVAYVLSDNWLTDFAYRIELGAEPFVISALLTLSLVAITVSVQSWRSATTDPIESLRYE